jgi:crossover junction endodeoxyribonuclease RuvC
MYRYIIGIDPGKSGAVVIMSGVEGKVFDVFEFKKFTHQDIAFMLKNYAHGVSIDPMQPIEDAKAYIEKVHSMPKQGVASSFKFGYEYGVMIGMLRAIGIPFEEVTPQKWQKAMGCMTKGDKNVTKRKAQDLFGDKNRTITHATADAHLIAEYGRRSVSTTKVLD